MAVLRCASILGPLLSLLSNPLQRRPGADNEPRAGTQLESGIESFTASSINRSRIVLRLLCRFRSAVESHHDDNQSWSVDEQDRHLCGYHWGVYGCYESSLEFLVSFTPSPSFPGLMLK